MSSTAGTPPSPTLLLPTSPDQPKGSILLNPETPKAEVPNRPQIVIPSSSSTLNTQINTAASKSPTSGQPRIRFAPLPDPRPRSLSTGRNIGWTSSVDEAGNETRHMEVRNIPQQATSYDTDEAITDDDDDDAERRMRGRSWSKGMESSWKISKKILTVGMWDDKEDKTYDGGMPLKKSVSTGGMTGSSPFRWSSTEDRRRSMLGLPMPVPAANTHRRMSSLDPSTSSASLGTSPQPVQVKLMNGRVYGARRATELAELQKKQREAAEPEFVEWGNAKQGAVTPTPKKSGGFLGDDDDGSGMEWVKRRREERQKREQEKKEAAANSENEHPPTLVHSHSSPEGDSAITPITRNIDLPTTPVIHISEPMSPHHTGPAEAIPIQIKEREDGGDVFEEDDDDDGDFSSDDEEEEEATRTTSSAAGIEIMSRHHH